MPLQLYTDGSCEPNPGKGGWGFAYIFGGEIILEGKGGGNNTTNNRMELMAILEGIKALTLDIAALSDRGMTIYSDSLWCINAINKTWRIKKNLDLVRNIQDQINHIQLTWLGSFEIKLQHVKGHSGIWQNELVDQLAAEGRNEFSK